MLYLLFIHTAAPSGIVHFLWRLHTDRQSIEGIADALQWPCPALPEGTQHADVAGLDEMRDRDIAMCPGEVDPRGLGKRGGGVLGGVVRM